MDLDLTQVRAFVTVADEGHVGRAGARLHLSQQAVSKRLARLERHLGLLLVRHATGVSLTENGRRILPLARELLAAADALTGAVNHAAPVPIRVDVWGHLHPPLDLVGRFGRPDVVIEPSMRRSLPAALAALGNHEVDLAFGDVDHLDEPLPDGFASRPVATTPLAALVGAGSDLATREVLSAGDLSGRPLFWPAGGSSVEVTSFAREYADSVGAHLSTVGRNLGLDDLLTQVCGDERRFTLVGANWPLPADARVRRVPVRPEPHYPWYAVWRVANPQRTLVDLLGMIFRSSVLPDPHDRRVWLPAATRRRLAVPAHTDVAGTLPS